MRLVDLVTRDTGAGYDQIMLLRHSNRDIEKLISLGGSVEEHTAIHRKNSDYDYWADGKPRIDVVAVVVGHRLFGVYRVVGVKKEGATPSALGSDSYRRFRRELKKKEEPARLFEIDRISSAADDKAVTGWTAPIRATLRYHPDRTTLFWKIAVAVGDRAPIYAEDREYTKAELDNAVCNNGLRFRNVQTSNREAVARQRVGQDVVRTWTLRNYSKCCAVCDVADERLLRASHIKGWAECEESRGDLCNVICLCSFHDALFENGYWSLDDRLRIVIRSDIDSDTIRGLLSARCSFRKSSQYPPALNFIRHHRTKHGLPSS
jgi:hypothetical protein